MKNNKGAANIWLVVLVVVLAVLAGYFAFQKSDTQKTEEPTIESNNENQVSPNDEIPGWDVYRGNGFEVSYPINLVALSSDRKNLEHVVQGTLIYNEKGDPSDEGSPMKDFTLTFYSENNNLKDYNSCAYYEKTLKQFGEKGGTTFQFKNISGIRYESGAEGIGDFRYCVKNENGENIFVIRRGFVKESYSLDLKNHPSYLSSEKQESLAREILSTFKFTQ